MIFTETFHSVTVCSWCGSPVRAATRHPPRREAQSGAPNDDQSPPPESTTIALTDEKRCFVPRSTNTSGLATCVAPGLSRHSCRLQLLCTLALRLPSRSDISAESFGLSWLQGNSIRFLVISLSLSLRSIDYDKPRFDFFSSYPTSMFYRLDFLPRHSLLQPRLS